MRRVFIMISVAAFLLGAMSLDVTVTGAFVGVQSLASTSPIFSLTAFLISFVFYLAGSHKVLLGRA